MARFFLDLQNDRSTIIDDEGAEFAGLPEACVHARTVIGDVLADELSGKTELIHLKVMIHDEGRERVATVDSVTKITETRDPFQLMQH